MASALEKVEESESQQRKLTESATGNEKKLQFQLDEARNKASKLEENLKETDQRLSKIEKDRQSALVRAYVFETTDGLPEKMAESIRVSVLGPDKDKGGVECGKSLREAYEGVTPPSSIEEAASRIRQSRALLESSGASTEKGRKIEENTDHTPNAREARAQRLSGLKPMVNNKK